MLILKKNELAGVTLFLASKTEVVEIISLLVEEVIAAGICSKSIRCLETYLPYTDSDNIFTDIDFCASVSTGIILSDIVCSKIVFSK